MNVVHFQRRPVSSHVSIERLFNEVRSAMPSDINCRSYISPHFSQGALPRISNLRDARRHQGEVNHIVGDVHYIGLALPSERTILTIHDCAVLERLRGWRRFVVKSLWFTLPMRRAAIITTISAATRAELCRHLPREAERVRVIHNCVGREHVPHHKAIAALKPEVLHVGTGPNKNLLRVGEALAGLPCVLHIVGRLTAEQINVLNKFKIEFRNTTKASDGEMLAAYQDCDLVLFPSTYEGFGMPIIEANAVGRPVITSNVYSMPEVAGDAACLVNPHQVSEIRAGLLRVWKNEPYRRGLIAAGYENVKRFSSEVIASAYARIYREIHEQASTASC